ncbi:response regulator transcription factor [Candidatus Microgenomates bacterium]|nr:response regulator transcription factor [Candidatus Microgenomates bacterium]
MAASILVVDDDRDFLLYVKDILIKTGYTVRTAGKGIDAIKSVDQQAPDLVILDLNLPDMKGEGVCVEIRKEHPMIPIIMLTSKDTVSEKVQGLSMGADDYITKPFIADEFLARVKARLRQTSSGDAVLSIADLVLDNKKIEVRRADKLISLTPHEFKLLEYLMQNKGVVLTRDMILNRVWSYSLEVESRVVDVYMGYLRKKIDTGHKKKLIQSVRGFGYTIKE